MLPLDRCESSELAAWRSLYLSLPSEVSVETGARLLEIEGTTVSSLSSADILAFNRVMGVGVGPVIGPDFSARMTEWYRSAGVPRYFVQVAPGPTSAESSALLVAAGLRHYNDWLRLARELGDQDISANSVAAAIEVRRTDGADDARRFARLVTSQFGWPESLDAVARAAVGAPQWMHYLAVDGDTVVGTGACFRDDDVAWLGFAATAPEYRRRGVQSALIARRLHDAREMGCRWAILESAESTADRDAPSSRNAERAGFSTLYRRPNYLGMTEAAHPPDSRELATGDRVNRNRE